MFAFSGTELIDAIREGDQQAFKKLFDRLYDDLFRFLLRRGHDAETSKDLIQQAFISLWEARAAIEASPRALLFRMVINRSVNHYRDSKNHADLSLVDLPDSSGSASKEVERKELKQQIHAAIQSLPDRRRQVFELCYMSGLTYREVARVLDVSIKTVENQMSTALRTLRKALSDDAE